MATPKDWLGCPVALASVPASAATCATPASKYLSHYLSTYSLPLSRRYGAVHEVAARSSHRRTICSGMQMDSWVLVWRTHSRFLDAYLLPWLWDALGGAIALAAIPTSSNAP